MKHYVLDLFSGAGGLSKGLELSGFSIKAAIDHDYWSSETFRYNFPEATVLVKDLDSYNPEMFSKDWGFKAGDFTVIAGGPPCQGFSISGARNFEDPRNKLYLKFIDYVKFFKPKAFVVENVPGLVGLYNGQVKDRLVWTFERLGYQVTYKIILASDYGVPQDRKRVFFVGVLNSVFNFPKQTHFSNNLSANRNSIKKVTVADAVNDLPLLKDEIGYDGQAYLHPPSNDFQRYCRFCAQKIYNHIGTKHTKQTVSIISLIPEGGNYKMLPIELRNTRNFHVAWTRIDSSKPSPTVDTGHRHHFHPWVNRVPTVRENARFQSFPDDFIFLGPKTSQYKQVGNAVPPLLSKCLGVELLKNGL